jgi:hypothetical protein
VESGIVCLRWEWEEQEVIFSEIGGMLGCMEGGEAVGKE